MRATALIFGASLAVALACGSIAQTPWGGYLKGREPETLSILPPAPEVGSPRDLADRAIFKATRALKDTPRWALATSDARISIADLLRDFSCATGVNLDERDAPALALILRRVVPDMVSAYGIPKDAYKRPRPYLRDAGEICVDRSDDLAKSWDYPSGHATFAWTAGLIFAELAPDRAGPILTRARAYGESRAICGVHSASAVTEARTAGSSLVAALHGDPVFRADLEAARAEMAALRTAQVADKPERCDAEAALTAITPW